MRACLTAALGRRGVLARERGDRACRSELRRPGFSQRLPDGAAVYRGADRRGRRGGAPGRLGAGRLRRAWLSDWRRLCAARRSPASGTSWRMPSGSRPSAALCARRSAIPLRPAEDTVTAPACRAGTSCLRRSSTPESAAQRSCGRSRPCGSRPFAADGRRCPPLRRRRRIRPPDRRAPRLRPGAEHWWWRHQRAPNASSALPSGKQQRVGFLGPRERLTSGRVNPSRSFRRAKRERTLSARRLVLVPPERELAAGRECRMQANAQVALQADRRARRGCLAWKATPEPTTLEL
jgi:hypothetical protein